MRGPSEADINFDAEGASVIKIYRDFGLTISFARKRGYPRSSSRETGVEKMSNSRGPLDSSEIRARIEERRGEYRLLRDHNCP